MSHASLFMVSLLVPDMDDGIAHFTHDWGFTLTKDTLHVSGHRWVEIAPDSGARLRLVEANSDEQRTVIGRQAGGRVAFFLDVSGFDNAVEHWAASGIEVVEQPRIESYGRIVVLRDKYGNRWDVLDAEHGKSA
jgi:predicted enzyme related to lactoylglutathione lyase